MIEHTMTVRELIEVLQKVENQDAPVYTEGCDCNGPAMSVAVDSTNVMIQRGLYGGLTIPRFEEAQAEFVREFARQMEALRLSNEERLYRKAEQAGMTIEEFKRHLP